MHGSCMRRAHAVHTPCTCTRACACACVGCLHARGESGDRRGDEARDGGGGEEEAEDEHGALPAHDEVLTYFRTYYLLLTTCYLRPMYLPAHDEVLTTYVHTTYILTYHLPASP